MLRSDDSAFSSGLPFTRLARLAIAFATVAGALALGCKPQIGDKCTVSTNCSTTGDRLCDVTQPDGYCTTFNCEPGNCPEDSVCVNFGTTLSPVQGCTPSQANSPYKRSFCMASCGADDDCRSGYKCLTPRDDCRPGQPSSTSDSDCFNAVLAEHSSGNKVCAVPPNRAPPEDTPNQVCIGSDAGPPEGGSSSTAGSGGGSGAAEGGSSSGAGAGGAAGDGGSDG
jgi:uncharacterized membrane protein YgcG